MSVNYSSKEVLMSMLLPSTVSTPLHSAAGNGFKDNVGMLLHNGAYYNALDGSKLTPLQWSKENSIITLLRIVEELLELWKETITYYLKMK
ncbi:hypothetical protein CEXT_676331 [Caerostris extrusa]|uniref:Uncharacterized protein n=1 Tax=Caerostris extrusa TaxID=172846 RepID=A0AAV4WQR1_CAEEX|nr:hypothetical protein CEXT_676331 [Caerostris extrusa]